MRGCLLCSQLYMRCESRSFVGKSQQTCRIIPGAKSLLCKAATRGSYSRVEQPGQNERCLGVRDIFKARCTCTGKGSGSRVNFSSFRSALTDFGRDADGLVSRSLLAAAAPAIVLAAPQQGRGAAAAWQTGSRLQCLATAGLGSPAAGCSPLKSKERQTHWRPPLRLQSAHQSQLAPHSHLQGAGQRQGRQVSGAARLEGAGWPTPWRAHPEYFERKALQHVCQRRIAYGKPSKRASLTCPCTSRRRPCSRCCAQLGAGGRTLQTGAIKSACPRGGRSLGAGPWHCTHSSAQPRLAHRPAACSTAPPADGPPAIPPAAVAAHHSAPQLQPPGGHLQPSLLRHGQGGRSKRDGAS